VTTSNGAARDSSNRNMKTAIITGSNGLIGSESCRRFAREGYAIVGIDNNMRSYFFGESASTLGMKAELEAEMSGYLHEGADIRDMEALRAIFDRYGSDVEVVIHTAAQPSHDWAAKEPLTDFGVNAMGTINLLECVREFCPEAVFIFTSTNKVYLLPAVFGEQYVEHIDDHDRHAWCDDRVGKAQQVNASRRNERG